MKEDDRSSSFLYLVPFTYRVANVALFFYSKQRNVKTAF